MQNSIIIMPVGDILRNILKHIRDPFFNVEIVHDKKGRIITDFVLKIWARDKYGTIQENIERANTEIKFFKRYKAYERKGNRLSAKKHWKRLAYTLGLDTNNFEGKNANQSKKR